MSHFSQSYIHEEGQHIDLSPASADETIIATAKKVLSLRLFIFFFFFNDQ